jgi:hypothetical protein
VQLSRKREKWRFRKLKSDGLVEKGSVSNGRENFEKKWNARHSDVRRSEQDVQLAKSDVLERSKKREKLKCVQKRKQLNGENGDEHANLLK